MANNVEILLCHLGLFELLDDVALPAVVINNIFSCQIQFIRTWLFDSPRVHPKLKHDRLQNCSLQAPTSLEVRDSNSSQIGQLLINTVNKKLI